MRAGRICLECHPRLTQPGQTRVPQLVTRRMIEPGPLACAAHDLLQPFRRQSLSTVGSFQHNEHELGIDIAIDIGGWSFRVEIGGDTREESR
jgi:hypothetical protein